MDSQKLPGQTHKWRLAKWLQLGYKRSNENLKNDLSIALHLLIVTAKRRFFYDVFSLLQSLYAWKRGTLRLIDILIGIPRMKVVDYEDKLLEKEIEFLVEDLQVDVNKKRKLNYFYS